MLKRYYKSQVMASTMYLWVRYTLKDLYGHYILNEITHALFAVWVFTQSDWPFVGSSSVWIAHIPGSQFLEPYGYGLASRLCGALVIYSSAYTAVGFGLWLMVLTRRQLRDARVCLADSKPTKPFAPDIFVERSITTRQR